MRFRRRKAAENKIWHDLNYQLILNIIHFEKVYFLFLLSDMCSGFARPKQKNRAHYF